MSQLTRHIIFLILQFLNEEKLEETVHKFERDSGLYFNMKYFEDEVRNGNWDEVERYLSGFTKVNDHPLSLKVFFEIRKQKYLEALDEHDRAKALEILMNDLTFLSSYKAELFKEMAYLLTLENFREHQEASKYGDMKSTREIMLVELKRVIEVNPLFHGKLHFPSLKNSSLITLVGQGLNWEREACKNPKPNPDINTLFVHHSCGQPNVTQAPLQGNSPLLGTMPTPGGFPPFGAHGPFQPAPVPAPLAGWMSTVSAGAIGLSGSTNPVGILKHPITPPTNNPVVDYSPVDYDHVTKRARPMGISDEVTLPVNILPLSYPQNHSQATYTPDDLPKNVARTLYQCSTPMSMDFHPIHQTILLVGSNVGNIELWDVGTRERLVLKNFKVWGLGACAMAFQNALVTEPGVSVNRIIWSPDGSMFGVAYSRHIVHIYSYHGGDDVRQHLEINAHVGGVNDVAFSNPNNQSYVITCGDDKTIKVWDAATGTKQHSFEGHEAPVYSVCPHQKENIHFIFSTALDGKIKAWLYDNLGSRVDYDAPGFWCITLVYSADGSRLFSCGTSKEGKSYIVEWNESEGSVKRTYQGFPERSWGVVQFDTTRNRYLAAGDESLIKFWDMDNTSLLTTTAAEGNLPASPRIRFNKEGTLLAVSTDDNGIIILANADGLRSLQSFENCSLGASSTVTETAIKPIINPLSAIDVATSSGITERAASSMALAGMDRDIRNLVNVNPRITDESMDKSKINEPAQCRSVRLMDNLRTSKISRLIYTNSGVSILALASNAIHLLWKWPRNEHNPSGKATANVSPQLWQPPSGILMTNEITDTNPEAAVPCFALSKNDYYVVSASGGKISLYNMLTFKTMATFMAPPPAATFLAFHPQDTNVIAIGMDDSTIQIYNVRIDELKSKLRGHSKRITGLAFSHVSNVLVSSGADARICVWGTDLWEKQRTKLLKIPRGHTPNAVSDTRVQFHKDQIQFLMVHKTQIAIFETKKLVCINKWTPLESSAPISHATFSCDSRSIYVCLLDATVFVFSAVNLRLRCMINPAAYLPANISSTVYPLVIAAHPSEPNQFALGLTDGGIHVLEPLESEGKWGVAPSAESGSASRMSTVLPTAMSSSDKPQR